MVAMEEEAQYLYPLLEDVTDRPPVRGIVRAVRGSLHGLTVDVVISGIGAVYASCATTATLTQEPALAVLSCGCSGAHMPEQTMGDIVIGSRVVPLSAEVIDRQGNSRLAGVRCSMLDAATMSFDADPFLLGVATEAAMIVRDRVAHKADGQTFSGACTGPAAPRVDIGVVGSSDVWRQSPAEIARVNGAHQSLCEEMEAHAVAQVCAVFGVPFVAIKDVANSEIHPEPIQLEPTDSIVPDTCQVGLHAARVTVEAIKLMSSQSRFDGARRADALGSKKRSYDAAIEAESVAACRSVLP